MRDLLLDLLSFGRPQVRDQAVLEAAMGVSLNNLTPADVYTGRGHTILLEREKTKRRTMRLRRLQHAKSAA